MIIDGLSEPLCNNLNVFSIRLLWQHNRKLISTETGRKIIAPDHVSEDCAQFFQYSISAGMSIGVIHLFKVIYIHHDAEHYHAETFCSFDLTPYEFIEVFFIVQSSQSIHD